MTTPKEFFLSSGKSGDFAKMVGTEAFITACDYALLELQASMPPNTMPGLPTDPYVGLDANAQMFGARRVLQILKALPIADKPTTPPKRERLDYARE